MEDSVFLKYKEETKEFDWPLRPEDKPIIESAFKITLSEIKDGNKTKAFDRLQKGKTYTVEGHAIDSCWSRHSLGWKRDLLRECVEPNPGPGLVEGLKAKVLASYSAHWDAWKPALERLESEIAKHPTIGPRTGFGVSSAHGLEFLATSEGDAFIKEMKLDSYREELLRWLHDLEKGIAQSGGAVSPVDPEMKELMKRLETTVLEQAKLLEHFKRDHYSYSFSKIPASWQRPFQFDLLGRDETCAFLSLPKNDFYSCIDPYDWDPKMTEHQQMDGILAWLKKALFKYKAPKKSSFPVPLDKQYYNIQDRHEDTQVLKFALDGANYRGGVDILILDREREKYPWQFTYVVIEIKTPSVVQDPASVRQWEAELIGSCIASKYPVISVLTDLDKHWSFQWFSAKGRTTRVEFDVAGDAIAFLRLILQPSPTKGVPNYALPVAQVPLETAMPQFSLDSHQTSDVAQLMDLLPFLAGEERYEISREISKQVLFSMYI